MERGDRRVEVLDYSEEFGKSFSDPSLNIEVISYTTPAPYAFTTESVKSTIDRNAALQLALSQRAIPGSDLYTFIPQDLAIDDGSLAAAAPFKSDIGREAIADGSKFKPLSKDAVVRPTGDRIVVRVQNDRSAVLVLREYLMPGWRAFIDGAQSPIYFADGIGMAVFVPSGFHTIDYTFTSPGLRVGEMLTIITLIVMISSIILTLRPIRGHV
jgi:hypothetical protein